LARTSDRSWTIRDAHPEDRDASIELAYRAFEDSPFSVDASMLWDWLFVGHPAGPGAFVVADAGERLAGQYATVPVRLQHGGRVIPALMSVQTATDPAFQRQGILSALAENLYEQTRVDVPVVFGFPNPAVAPARYGRLGWVELRPFPLLGRPVAGLPPLRPTRQHITTFESFGSWADELWEDVSPDLGTCAVRDSTYLNWRFCDSPYEYLRFAVVRNNAIVAFAVLGFARSRGRRVAYVMELMARAGDGAAARALVAHCLHAAGRSGARVISTIATRRHPHRRAFLRAGLLPLPRPLRRSFSFGVRHNGPGAVPNELFHIDDWYLSPADLDYV
jgi:GNAT superfamily N-acetyltransferase